LELCWPDLDENLDQLCSRQGVCSDLYGKDFPYYPSDFEIIFKNFYYRSHKNESNLIRAFQSCVGYLNTRNDADYLWLKLLNEFSAFSLINSTNLKKLHEIKILVDKLKEIDQPSKKLYKSLKQQLRELHEEVLVILDGARETQRSSFHKLRKIAQLRESYAPPFYHPEDGHKPSKPRYNGKKFSELVKSLPYIPNPKKESRKRHLPSLHEQQPRKKRRNRSDRRMEIPIIPTKKRPAEAFNINENSMRLRSDYLMEASRENPFF